MKTVYTQFGDKYKSLLLCCVENVTNCCQTAQLISSGRLKVPATPRMTKLVGKKSPDKPNYNNSYCKGCRVRGRRLPNQLHTSHFSRHSVTHLLLIYPFTSMAIFWAILLILVLLACWLLTIIGAPGNWFMIVAVFLYVLFGPEDGHLQIHWAWIIGLIVFAALGEIFEFLAGAFGAAKMGGSKRGATLAFVGSLIGGIVGLYFGLPIPIIGQLVAALLFACLGALVGAMMGEKWKGRDWKESFQIGTAAAVGRFFGTVGKVAFGLLMIASVCFALLF